MQKVIAPETFVRDIMNLIAMTISSELTIDANCGSISEREKVMFTL